jgi:hypothetical protein
MKTTTLGVKYHAQIQTIDGVTFEFQPEHLFCEDCWKNADNGLAHAAYFGACQATGDLDENFKWSHAITVTKIGKETK